jgi:benzil reductase ((S)-benzoin forming)
VAERYGRIDLWINNAGVLDPVAFVRDLSKADLMRHLSINVGGVIHGSAAFVKHRRDGEGVLVNISSGAALRGYPAWGAYCASKAAVDRLTECLQLEEPQLRAYSVAPGVIDTDMQARVRSLSPDQFPMVEKFIELKRQGAYNSPRYVADRLLEIAFDPGARPDAVVLRLPEEHPGKTR